MRQEKEQIPDGVKAIQTFVKEQPLPGPNRMSLAVTQLEREGQQEEETRSPIKDSRLCLAFPSAVKFAAYCDVLCGVAMAIKMQLWRWTRS